jgi:hypothetical protein
MSPIGGG